MSDDTIVIDVTYPQAIERVWQALATREALELWLMPSDFEPRVGHEFTFQSSSNQWRGTIHCRVVECQPPFKLAYSWASGGIDTLVTFTLASTPEGTRLRLAHSGFRAGGALGATARAGLGSGWTSKFVGGSFATYLMRQREPVPQAHSA
jgi:uncharacterized protein YndB with AHSA1/START domain